MADRPLLPGRQAGRIGGVGQAVALAIRLTSATSRQQKHARQRQVAQLTWPPCVSSLPGSRADRVQTHHHPLQSCALRAGAASCRERAARSTTQSDPRRRDRERHPHHGPADLEGGRSRSQRGRDHDRPGQHAQRLRGGRPADLHQYRPDHADRDAQPADRRAGARKRPHRRRPSDAHAGGAARPHHIADSRDDPGGRRHGGQRRVGRQRRPRRPDDGRRLGQRARIASVLPALHPDPGERGRPGGHHLPAAHRPVAQGRRRVPARAAARGAHAAQPARPLSDDPSADARPHHGVRGGGGALALRQHAGFAGIPDDAPSRGRQADGLHHPRCRPAALRRSRPLGAGALRARHRLVPQGRAGLGAARHRRPAQGISERSLLPRGARPDAVRERPRRRGRALLSPRRPASAEFGGHQDRLCPRPARNQQSRQRPRGRAQPRTGAAAGIRYASTCGA